MFDERKLRLRISEIQRTVDSLSPAISDARILSTLFLSPPSFDGFDGGAGARYQARREVTSYWYPTWLAQPAALVKDSKLIDAPPARLGTEPVLAEAKKAKAAGATRYCMGAAWREVRDGFLADPEVQAAYKELPLRFAVVLQLIALREQRGWSLRELADRAGMKQPQLARL